MIIFWGTRGYGTVEQCGPASIITRFFHVQFLPLFPVVSVLRVQDAQGPLERPIPLHLGSVAAAYLRTWGLLAMLAAVYGALHSGPALHLGLGDTARLVVLFLGTALAAMAVFGLGHLSREQQAQRQVYAEFIGAPVDVARLYPRQGQPAEGDAALHQHLRDEVVERARSYSATSYREAADPQTAWDQIALGPAVSDARFLRAALTLARLEGATARGGRRQQLQESHAALWRKLQGL